MKKFFAVVMSVAMVAAFSPLAEAQSGSCPAEVAQAKEMLSKKSSMARSQDVQAPRSLAGSRQNVQAPRGQDVQAPRGQNIQAPRGQDVQAPRSLAGSQSASGITKAAQLVKDAEAACKIGDAKTAKDKATEAISILK
jgi:hypothetical protein